MKTKFLRKSGQFSIQGRKKLFRRNLSMVFRMCCISLLLLTVSFAYAAKVEDFLPQESVFYLKLQDIDEIYSEIETSEDWEKVLPPLIETPDWQQIQQGFTLVQGMLGTDPLGIFQMVGYRTALAAWTDEVNSSQIGIVIHSGGNLSALRQLTKILEGLIGMDGNNTLHLDAGVYQRVRYNAIERFGSIVKYGFVDDFLVIGANEGCFEKMLDVYRTGIPSIQENKKLTSTLKRIESGQVIVFADVPSALSFADRLSRVGAQRIGCFSIYFWTTQSVGNRSISSSECTV